MKVQLLILAIILSVAAAAACSSAAVNVNVSANANVSINAEPVGTPIAAAGEALDIAAQAVVADLYKAHDSKKSPFFQTKDRALVDKYFIKALADLIWKDATTSNGEVGALDGDPLYNAQDTDIKNFAVGRADIKGEAATVPVTFTNFGNKQTINFRLKRVKDAWKIEDIDYGSGETIVKWLKETGTGASTDGVFEGKYEVGDTTCTVTPVKMSYEVRWAKGSGVEMFFFKDGATFGSDGGNQFIFDDDNYNSGTFHRADGKNSPVKRVK
jgi:hypothetical protein